jgi:hypothetical protein
MAELLAPEDEMTDHEWLPAGYRRVPEYPDYAMSAACDVWSLPRHVPGKGDSLRYIRAKQLKPSAGRVTLRNDGVSGRFHVARELFPRVFPDRLRTQVICKHGHPLHDVDPDCALLVARRLGTPSVKVWGTGNRICLRCHTPPDHFATDNLYSVQYGVAGMPDYSNAPATPGELYRDGELINDLLATGSQLATGGHGFSVR